jgi:hypothetical protein
MCLITVLHLIYDLVIHNSESAAACKCSFNLFDINCAETPVAGRSRGSMGLLTDWENQLT